MLSGNPDRLRPQSPLRLTAKPLRRGNLFFLEFNDPSYHMDYNLGRVHLSYSLEIETYIQLIILLMNKANPSSLLTI